MRDNSDAQIRDIKNPLENRLLALNENAYSIWNINSGINIYGEKNKFYIMFARANKLGEYIDQYWFLTGVSEDTTIYEIEKHIKSILIPKT
jgi:hypothetical protein